MKRLPSDVKLVAVSKYHPEESIVEAYGCGQRRFAESRPQEFQRKYQNLQLEGVEWHFIGHLQTNKLKMVLPYADLIQSVDSLHLLQEIDKWGRTNGKVIRVLLEMHVAAEDTKQGFAEEELLDILFNADRYKNIEFCGLMGMATNTDNEDDIRADFSRISHWFSYLKDMFPELGSFCELSIGMSGDWPIALEYGATMIRVGTSIFGERQY